jgi:signal transduction histidine kinase
MGVIVVRALGCLRIAQFLLWAIPTVQGIGVYSPVIPAAFVALTLWTTGLFVLALRARAMTAPLLLADVLGVVVTTIVVTRAYPLGVAGQVAHNGLVAPLCGTAVTVAVYAKRSGAVVGAAAVIAGWLVAAWPELSTASASQVRSDAVVIAVFALVTKVNGYLLFESARRTDAATDRALEAEHHHAEEAEQRHAAEARAVLATAREAAAEARDRERRRQYSALHDTVLHTLEKIARRVWDVQSTAAIENCERDAEYLRGLITGSSHANVPTDLGTAMAAMTRNRDAWGSLRVNQQFDDLPEDLPQEVVEALVGVTRESLNNVAKYAQVDQVWVTGYGDGYGGVTLKVVDQGVGFDPEATHAGWGLPWSMRGRVEEIGGAIAIRSAPGEGTNVEVSWNP